MRRLPLLLVFLLTVSILLAVSLLVAQSYNAPHRPRAAPLGSSCTTVVIDDFSTDTLANYTQVSGTWSIAAGVITAPGSGVNLLVHDTANGSVDGWSCMRYVDVPYRNGAAFRADASGTAMYAARSSHTISTWRSCPSLSCSSVESDNVTVGADTVVCEEHEGTGTSTVIRYYTCGTTTVTTCPSEDAACTLEHTFTADPASASDSNLGMGLYNEGGQFKAMDDFAFGTLN